MIFLKFALIVINSLFIVTIVTKHTLSSHYLLIISHLNTFTVVLVLLSFIVLLLLLVFNLVLIYLNCTKHFSYNMKFKS